MPQVLAAVVRSEPFITIAIVSIRRACAGLTAPHASRRNSDAKDSVRSIWIAMPDLPQPEGITSGKLLESLANQEFERLV